MANLFSTLKSLPALQKFTGDKRLLIIELSEQRLATLLLRASPIWTFAVVSVKQVDGRVQQWESTTWVSTWQSKVSTLSGEDAKDIRRNGETPAGISVIEELTAEMNALRQQPDLMNADFILPIGALCGMKCFGELLARKNFPRAHILEADPVLQLPLELNTQNVRGEIARVCPPMMDADYTLSIAKFVEGSKPELKHETMPLITKTSAPPVANAWQAGVNQQQLGRALAQSKQPTPIHIIIQKNKMVVSALTGTPLSNVFYLRYWINYRDDQIGIQVVDAQGKPVALTSLSPAQIESARVLPAVENKCALDLAFIVDGTLRTGKGSNIHPDIEPTRQFLDALLTELQEDESLDMRVALCVYGDRPNLTGAEYAKYELPRHANNQFTEPRILQREINDPAKFKATEDRDYEALLEMALQWANRLPWRPGNSIAKQLVIIGSAPPHLPISDPYYPEDSGLTHEPFTSPVNYNKELNDLRAKGVKRWAVWVPFPELEALHPCLIWSKRLWNEKLAEHSDDYFETLEPETREKLLGAIRKQMSVQYITRTPVPLPMIQPVPSLMWIE